MGTRFFCPDLIAELLPGCSSAELRVELLELLRYASKGGIEEKGDACIQNIALLFDQLIALVAALEAMQRGGGAPHSQSDPDVGLKRGGLNG
ncbi:hypothetical protein D0C36_15895 [Mucilaginibacter conchicola]|uniref:Uncharacterized protein n=1 Tax=Mucilaginibacter conchicola TaxID=2303333 RepID=A0A372NUV0_9SPHI|nr:hypothetical protein [Mucilaginibacter conchicola]RFZ92872.1 hypothetical protein D0C36_15895 [Mucilaginibacter conchicola]